jgi:hypothetical protein
MKLHRPDPLFQVLYAGDCIGRLRHQFESWCELQRLVAVRHPDIELTGQVLEQRRAIQHLHLGVSILALVGRAHFAAQLMSDELQAVANSQHRDAEGKHAIVGHGSILVIDGTRPAAKDNAHGTVAADLFQRRGTGQDDGKNVLLADAACDELRILRAKIENYDGLI